MTAITCLERNGTDGAIDSRSRASANDYADAISIVQMTTRISFHNFLVWFD